jgi:hypothetical protein
MSRLNPKIYRGQCASGCGRPIFSKSHKTKYCSLSCSHTRYAVRRPPKNSVPCLSDCGTLIPRHKKYCSTACQQEYQFRIRCLELEAGRYHVISSNRLIRRYLVTKLGERCTSCGWDKRHELTGRVPVEVEHIDGNWQNNALSNLTLLCPNCHSLTKTFRGLNRGKGRPYRLGGRANPLGTGPISKEQKSKAARLPVVLDPQGRRWQLPLLLPT